VPRIFACVCTAVVARSMVGTLPLVKLPIKVTATLVCPVRHTCKLQSRTRTQCSCTTAAKSKRSHPRDKRCPARVLTTPDFSLVYTITFSLSNLRLLSTTAVAVCEGICGTKASGIYRTIGGPGLTLTQRDWEGTAWNLDCSSTENSLGEDS